MRSQVMTTQPMPLEDVIASLKELQPRGTPALQACFASALHHLEAGKDKRYTPQDMIFAASFGIERLGENFPELKPTTPTTEPQG